MVPFNSPTGECGPVLSYLDPPISAGQVPPPTDANRTITQNGQFFPLADQGNDGRKMFLNNIPSYHGTCPQAVRSCYYYFTQHASTCGFYVHPYFCFRHSAASLKGFTCGFDTPAVTAVVRSPYIPTTLGVVAVPTAMGIAPVAEILPTIVIDAVTSVPVSASTQHGLPGYF